jgi:hypothetical protein
MKRVVIVGQSGTRGPLSCERFSDLLSTRLGLRAETLEPQVLPVGLRVAYAQDMRPHAPHQARAHALALADTIVWLHFSPLPYLRDWLTGVLERVHVAFFQSSLRQVPAIATSSCAASRATSVDVAEAVARMTLPPELNVRRLRIERPSLSVIELRTPGEAFYWLRMQEVRCRDRA